MSQVDVLQPRSALGAPIRYQPYPSPTLSTGSLGDDVHVGDDVVKGSPFGSTFTLPSETRGHLPLVTANAHDEDLPALSSMHPMDLMKARIIQSNQDCEDDVADAEKAFFVADLGKVYAQFERWHRNLPEIEPYYAVKCNPDPYVLRLLAALGTGFDCASLGEIKSVLSVGVDPSKIIFANPCKSMSFIRSAARVGVDAMTFDNADELHKIARSGHANAKLVVRILTDDSKSLCRLGLKFGAPLSTVPGLLATAHQLGLDVIGVSFHVGSGNMDPNAYSDAISRAASAFEMGRAQGYRFTLLDVGGGFETHSFESSAEVLRRAMDVYFPKNRRLREGIKVIAEPGRYFVSEAFQIATNIIARRVSPKDPSALALTVEEDPAQPSVMYYINDGCYGAFNCIMFDHQVVNPYPLTIGRVPVTSTSAGNDHDTAADVLSSVWGPTCDSIDCVAPLCRLPSTLEVGDWLGFDSMGAYTICAASNFNGFEKSEVWYTAGASPEEAAQVRAVLGVKQ